MVSSGQPPQQQVLVVSDCRTEFWLLSRLLRNIVALLWCLPLIAPAVQAQSALDNLNRPVENVPGLPVYELAGAKFEFTRQLQFEMRRLGCYNPDVDRVDGKWGPNSSQSLKNLITFLEYRRLVDRNAVAAWTIEALDNSTSLLAILRDLPTNLCRFDGGRPGARSALDELNTPPFDNSNSVKYQYTYEMQSQLKRIGCFGGTVNGLWGPNSSRALINLVAALQSSNVPGWSLDALKSAPALTAVVARIPEGICGESGVRQQTQSKSCSVNDVAKDYFAGLPPSLGTATRLSQPLEFVISRFDSVFSDADLDSFVGMTPEARKRITQFDQKGITRESTAKALQDAWYQFAKLAFLYGIRNKEECKICYKINEWRFLRNIAQSNAGYLVAKDNKTGAYFRFPVDAITEKLFDDIRDNIKILRSYANSITQAIATLPNKSQAEAGEIQERIQKINDARDLEMVLVVKWLAQAIDSERRVDARLMKDLALTYRCDGFDGSALDQ